MRTRTREVVRLLATFRHSARCRTLRAAAAQEARDLANEPSPDAPSKDDERAESKAPPVVRKPHPGMH